ncbi:MAG: MATE family efflux transporter [Eubacteriales bacterium]|nr:MATE family efflux transporter [Eubacteriales bacterium]
MIRDDRFLRREYMLTLIPVMFSVLAGTINTLIDSAFVARRLGSDALAAVNMCGPLYQVICTLGSLLAGGASILSSQEEGRENTENSRRYYHTVLLLGVILGLVCSLAGVLACRPIAGLLAQSLSAPESGLTVYVYDYCLVSFFGLSGVVLAYIPLYYLQLEGRRREIIRMMWIMILADIVLDGIFLYVFDWGMKGAAAASAVSMAASCIYGFFALQSKDSGYRFQPGLLGVWGWREIVKYGSPVAIGNLLDALRLLCLNGIILRTAGASGAAVWAVLNCFSELSLCISSGVPQTAGPMIAVFHAVRENSGIRILMRLQLRIGMWMTGIFSLALLLGNRGIRELFALSESVFWPLLCLGISLFFEMLCSCWSSLFNSTDRIALSNLLVGLKRFFFPVAVALALAGAGLAGNLLWSFLPVSGLLSVLGTAAVTLSLSARSRRKGHPLSGLLLLDDELEREGRVLDFSTETIAEKICEASERIRDFCIKNRMDERETISIGMAIEELLVVMKAANPQMESVDLRVFALEDTTGIRVRSAGKRYNPFEKAQEAAREAAQKALTESGEQDMFYLGVTMLQNMAKETSHSYALGMNTLFLSFERKE